jgi:hypothetical protein
MTIRHGLNAKIWLDMSSAGTFAGGSIAAGTANLTILTGKNSWSFDQSRDFVDVTSFLDTSKTQVAGLPGASGSLSGNFDFATTGIYNVIGATSERAVMIWPDWTNEATTFIWGKAFFSAKTGGSTTTADSFDLDFQAGPSGMTWTHP